MATLYQRIGRIENAQKKPVNHFCVGLIFLFDIRRQNITLQRMGVFRRTLLVVSFLAWLASCSAFQIRHTDDKGTTRTYVSDTIFVGTGTFLDCIASPLYFIAGLFYLQPYIHVKGGNLSYPSIFGSGCLFRSSLKGNAAPSWFGIGWLNENGANQVIFVDMNQKETMLTGGSLEITRVTDRINFSTK